MIWSLVPYMCIMLSPDKSALFCRGTTSTRVITLSYLPGIKASSHGHCPPTQLYMTDRRCRVPPHSWLTMNYTSFRRSPMFSSCQRRGWTLAPSPVARPKHIFCKFFVMDFCTLVPP